MKMEAKRLSLAVFGFVFLALSLRSAVGEEKCIGKADKDSPSKEVQNFTECKPFREKSCCTANFANTVKNDTYKRYEVAWDHCRTNGMDPSEVGVFLLVLLNAVRHI